MDDLNGQGSPESPSSASVLDGITAHIQHSLNPQAQPSQGATTQPEQPQQAGEAQTTEQSSDPTQESPQTRFEERINQLTREREEAIRQAEALQLFIASNPQARAAYEAALTGQPQQSPQTGFYQPQPEAPLQLPEYDAFEEETMKQYSLSWFEEAARPHLQELTQMKQVVGQLVEFVQDLQQREIYAQQQQIISSVDDFVFSEIPSAKENDVHFGLVDYCIRQELLKVPENERNSQKLQEVTRIAVNRAKQMIQQAGGIQQSVTQTIQGTPVKTFSEGGTNMVSPTPKNETVEDGIIAHLRAKGIF